MKKIILFVLIFLLLTGFSTFASEPVTISVNGEEMQTKGVLKDDRTFVPIRFVAQGLGAEVKWNVAENAVYIYEQPDKIIPESKWFNEEFDKMMQSAFEAEGLDFHYVQEKTSYCYVYNDGKVYVEAKVSGVPNGKLIVHFYGEGISESTRNLYIGVFWYYDLETGNYGKIGDGFYPFSCCDGAFTNEKYNNRFYFADYNKNLIFFNMETSEKYELPDCEVIAILGDIVYYTKNDGKLYIHYMETGEENVIELNKKGIYRVASGFFDGINLYVHMSGRDVDDVWKINLDTMQMEKIDYEENEWLFYTVLHKNGQEALYCNEVGVPKIWINDVPMPNIPEAFLLNDRTYVPLRFIAEEMGAEVKWIDGEKRVEITKKANRKPWYKFASDNSGDIWKYN